MKKVLAVAMLTLSPFVYAKDLTIAINADPDALDPDTSTSMVGREVFTNIFDKLIDINQDLSFKPMLATSWAWSTDMRSLEMTLRDDVIFHDGSKFNAEVVKFNIDRSKNMESSRRKGDLKIVETVDVVDEYTVRFNLSEPFSPLLAALADRSGMMVSMTAAKQANEAFSKMPIGSGPYQFESRVAQDKIVLDKNDSYWEADHYHFEKVTYLPLPDTTIRLANLKSGQVDIAERIAPTDIASLKSEDRLTLVEAAGIGFNGITFNLGYGLNQGKESAVKNADVRKAFELSIDRNIVNQVVFSNQYIAGNQWVPPNSSFYDKNATFPARDITAAKQLLEKAGKPNPTIDFMVPNTTENLHIAQVIQAMAGEAGFVLNIKATEFATSLQKQAQGDYEMFLIGWSGRIDPDGNIFSYYSKGGALNENNYNNNDVQTLISKARSEDQHEIRVDLYQQAMKTVLNDRPYLYLYHPKWQWGVSKDITGFKGYGDGMPRLRDVIKQ
ncbi:ABC transporter substrate-binding protein [Vibrio sp. SS-MA-C1-2]|uniref:ABC transporter substrate-binding protein n=1 Tax=Vibrio sp. SS-MA-C1-2 TaxID=2908646 RepID=UPI001F21F5CD|nr:ABC transporter substrate-binding protein [Vibrio sp. SS-MA-C1-2]UJF17895.1 ABC transporter substrate-binding protein [Vibrio sp. SS-MA-C1-2]